MDGINQQIAYLAAKVLQGDKLSRNEALSICGVCNEDLYDLFYWANKIRIKFAGSAVHCCSIVASKVGACGEDCKFCSQAARYNTHVKGVKFLGTESIIAAAQDAAQRGATAFGLVNSGLAPSDEEIERLAEPLKKIVEDIPIAACASLGILSEHQAERLASLGVREYNHNLQTSRRFFSQIVTTHSYDQRVETIKAIKRAGMRVCCGGLFGMGETWADRVDLALTLRELEVETVPINFLIPIPGTPLQNRTDLKPLDCLKIVSLYRFLLPDRIIKVAGGREVHLRDLQSWIFFAGANGLLLGNYLTTWGRSADEDLQMLADLELSWGPDHPKLLMQRSSLAN